MKITIDYNFDNWNDYINKERSNKYWASSIKKKELDIIRYHTMGIKYKGNYPIKIKIYKHFKDKRQDLDNVRIKGILDGLVKCGVIKNDNLNCITNIEYIAVIDGKEYIELEIKEVI